MKKEINKTKKELLAEIEELRCKSKEREVVLNQLKQQLNTENKLIVTRDKIEHINAIIENIQDNIWAVNNKYEIIYINSVFAQEFQFAYGKKLKIGTNILNALPDEIRQEWKNYYNKALANERFRFEKKFVFPGHTIYAETAMNPIVVDGQTIGVSCYAKNITEREKIKDSLIESEERYRALSEASFESIFISEKGVCLEQNATAEKEFGYSSSEAVGRMGTEWIAPEDRDVVMKNMISGFEEPYEAKALRKDGSTFLAEIQARMMHYKGRYVRVTALRDITKRKKAEEDKKQSRENLHNFFNTISEFLWVLDTQGNIITVNNTVIDRLGYSEEELIGNSVLMVHPPALRNEAGEIVKDMLLGKRDSCPIPIMDKLDNAIPVETYIEQGKWNGEDALFGVSKDISKLKLSEEKFLKAFHINPAISGITELETGKYIEVNQAFLDILGYKKDEVIGKISSDLVKMDKEFSEKARTELLRHGSLRNKETIIYTKKREPKNVLFSAEIISIQGKKYNFAIALDITRMKKTEKELIKAKVKAEESDRLKSAFLSNMSHEIRTPMNGILGFTQLLKESKYSGSEKEHFISIIEKSGNRMLDTINDIIDISKIEAGQIEVVNTVISVNKILEDQYSFFYNETKSKGIDLIYQACLSDKESYILIDESKLVGILTNLIKNAIKYTKNGSVSFGCSLNTKGDIKTIDFYVKDTGIGIPADRMDAIFNRFEQADIEDSQVYEGSGLGLAITKSYVEMLGGKISVYSKEGKGSKFIFSLPYRQNEFTNTLETAYSNNKKFSLLSNLSILIAEDDDISKLFFKTILKNKIKTLTFANNGKETINKLKEAPDTDIILMDIKMPEMNGYIATREIRKFNKKVIIIAQTAFGLQGERKKALAAGCDEYISKPIDRDLLFEKIRLCIDKKD